MDAPPAAAPPRTLTFKQGALWTALTVASFHIAHGFSAGAFLIAFHFFCLLQLARVRTARVAMRLGVGTGMCLYGPKLLFFWKLFGPTAVVLWFVLAFWLGLFLLLLQACRTRCGGRWAAVAAVAAPMLWTGLEYFRSELYYLRFSWLNAGYAFAESPALPALKFLGMYGVGFVLMSLASLAAFWIPRSRGEAAEGSPAVQTAAPSLPSQGRRRPALGIAIAVALLAALGVVTNLPFPSARMPETLRVAGIQLEFPGEPEVLQALDQLRRAHPEAELLVLSEYTFTDGPVPARVRAWCRTQGVYLAVGAHDELPGGAYYNTIFVVGPDGEIAFQQAKMQPIQFFKDGLPARSQRVWNSPWGRLGICICYDLSYTRVVDELVRQGAQALLVPTMDVADWGEGQHRLHARVAPVRAAEYGLPIFRLASSGISQWADERGVVRASAPFPGEGAMLAAPLRLVEKAALPPDRYLAPAATALTALLAAWLAVSAVWKRWSTKLPPALLD